MKRQSLSQNLILQFIYQGLILVIPFVLSPYLTRTLQETALGIYSYTNSVAYYFVILSMLGISRHGQRLIAQNAHNEMELRKAFWSLFALHVLVSICFTCCYIVFVNFFGKDYRVIYLIQTMYVLSALFDITWLFYGLENFKSVVLKNAAVKVLECALIFLFIRTPEDLWKYTAISAGGILLGQVVMVPQAVKVVKPISFGWVDVRQHIRPLLLFSISVIAASLYTVFDKTLLGLLSTKENVAFYEYSNKIVNIPKSIIGVVGTVMFPRACKLASVGDNEGQKKYIRYSMMLTSLIGMGAIFGLLAIATPFVSVYYGEAFYVCGGVIMALSPLIFIIGIGDIIRTQYMIPNHMDRQFNICIILNAIVNILLSTLLIPIIGIYGAVIGTVAAECFGIVYQLILCRRFIGIGDVVKTVVPFVGMGALMFIGIKLLDLCFDGSVETLVLKIILGACIYLTLCVIFIAYKYNDLWRICVKKISHKK